MSYLLKLGLLFLALVGVTPAVFAADDASVLHRLDTVHAKIQASKLSGHTLRSGHRGIERETLRVTKGGALATTPHHRALGSPLTHPLITTDFTEPQVEFTTKASTSNRRMLASLNELHHFTHRRIGDEHLWATSMPCALPNAAHDIPIANYGTSLEGQVRSLYRHGLGARYGRKMQTISGVHFNYSLPADLLAYLGEEHPAAPGEDGASHQYFRTMRNYMRYGWLITLLFGASPAFHPSFIDSSHLQPEQRARLRHDEELGVAYRPHATSLRNSNMGYANNRAEIQLSMANLGSYLRDVRAAMQQPVLAYQHLEQSNGRGPVQISSNMLQLASEAYGVIRPKRVPKPGQRLDQALKRGVQYVEVRNIDVDPFSPNGVSPESPWVLEPFLILCALKSSPPILPAERQHINDNLQRVATRGRKPGLQLNNHGTPVLMTDWARDLLTETLVVADALDDGLPDRPYASAVNGQLAKVEEPTSTPSAKVLSLIVDRRTPYLEAVDKLSRAHRNYFGRQFSPDASMQRGIEQMTIGSVERQQALESAFQPPLQDYLRRYLAD